MLASASEVGLRHASEITAGGGTVSAARAELLRRPALRLRSHVCSDPAGLSVGAVLGVLVRDCRAPVLLRWLLSAVPQRAA